MSKVRKILYPISILYGEITKARNKMFDKGVLKSIKFEIPVIVVGNLSVGGTGKTPQIEYLIRLLKDQYRVAVLSRGYKRKSKGFIIASNKETAHTIGDEPFQYYKKFDDIIVAVDADRVNGIQQLKKIENPPEVILLDDAFQHRKVAAGFNILLTSYNDLYVDDSMLPSGNLREKIEGANRAQVIIVTKCPKKLDEREQYQIAAKLEPTLYQTVFFSTIEYDEVVKSNSSEMHIDELKDYEILLITGIANPKPLCSFLKSKKLKFEHLEFPDHHNFTKKDFLDIRKKINKFNSTKKLILTTEKDFVRLNENIDASYIEIRTKFLNHAQDFQKLIQNYVGESTRNS
ncbi:tetraacyldisaccharide 4'-kinase [Urechidicola croceus]|uniref:Tetraacyldisaccharide 4'-kinase n=1 Tax=Urechidicola croceus TaxID=1850246 RepID=A0A1D8P6V3_9FLAO|nr:tetraacyldisaccharide 4'-kinase [Urechidicola croceus]AOW20277.1 tetraacyldisaccharide 4'-kinase [Urechidicola croceus]